MAEEFEVSGPHEEALEHATKHARESNDNFAGNIAVVTAILATLGALFSYEAGNTQATAAMYKNDEAIKKTEASDKWNFYQAKSNKQNLAELAISLPGVDVNKYQNEITKYKAEKESIKKEAEALEEESKNFNEKSEAVLHQHHRWASAMTALQIAISLAAISLLTRRKWLKNGVYAVAAVGLVFATMALLSI
jgi:predicted ribosome quality control (RQC) complex YloA/Tae2 family protein